MYSVLALQQLHQSSLDPCNFSAVSCSSELSCVSMISGMDTTIA